MMDAYGHCMLTASETEAALTGLDLPTPMIATTMHGSGVHHGSVPVPAIMVSLLHAAQEHQMDMSSNMEQNIFQELLALSTANGS